MIYHLQQRASAKSAAVLTAVENRLHGILQCWLVLVGLATMARIAASPFARSQVGLSTVAPYLLLIVAPVAATLLALRLFRDGHLQPQPMMRLAHVGRWKSVPLHESMAHPLYGTGGIMVSLLVGMMMNAPLRAVEYLASMPAVPASAPLWLSTLHFMMSLDVILFSSLYMVAFAAALRRVPLFPRLLAAIWAADIAMQLVIASTITQVPHLPPEVATALHGMLEGNLKKVLISVAL
ncbi:MAG: DUF2569 domain-containing protein, partial [Sphingomicrobium sp.]